MKVETQNDIAEILKMVLVIFLWIAAYSIGLELIKAYTRNEECTMQDLTEPVYARLGSACGKQCGKEIRK